MLFFEERLSIGNLSLSNFWKLFVFLIFFILLIKKRVKSGISNLDFVLFLFSLSFFVNFNSIFSVSDIEELVFTLILPLSYYSFYYLYKNKNALLRIDLLFLSIFLILSAVPFLLKIIEPINSIYSESRLKFVESYEMTSSMLIGFFKQPSLSSKVFVFSTIIVWAFGFKKKANNQVQKIFFSCIFLLGIYEVYRSFTRTGWIMIILFFFTSLIFRTGYSKIRKFFLLGFLLLITLFFYNSNDAIKNRMSGLRTDSFTDVSNITKLTSGRDIVMTNSLKSITSEGGFALFFGLGKDFALNKTSGALAHNRFIEIFQYGGFISLVLYLSYLFLLYKEIIKRKSKSDTYSLSLSLFILMIFSLIPSHGLPIWADILFGGVIAINRLDYELKNLSIN